MLRCYMIQMGIFIYSISFASWIEYSFMQYGRTLKWLLFCPPLFRMFFFLLIWLVFRFSVSIVLRKNFTKKERRPIFFKDFTVELKELLLFDLVMFCVQPKDKRNSDECCTLSCPLHYHQQSSNLASDFNYKTIKDKTNTALKRLLKNKMEISFSQYYLVCA